MSKHCHDSLALPQTRAYKNPHRFLSHSYNLNLIEGVLKFEKIVRMFLLTTLPL